MLYVVNASAQFAKAVFAIELASVPWFERLVGAIDLGSLIVTIMVCPSLLLTAVPQHRVLSTL